MKLELVFTKDKIMFKFLNETKGKIAATLFRGMLSSDDCKHIAPVIEKKIKQFGKICWYFELEELQGLDINNFWQNLSREIKDVLTFEKIALVGDERCESIVKSLASFIQGEIKFFPSYHRKAAMDWVQASQE